MLPERKWETEPLLRYIAGVCFCLSIGALAAGAFLPQGAAQTLEGKFSMMVTNAVVLHGGVLLLTAVFLRAHGIGWCEGFGWRLAGLPRAIGLGLLGVLLALPVTLTLQQLSQRGLMRVHEELVAHEVKAIDVKPEAQQLVQTLQQTETTEQRIFFALIAIVFAPLVEEILFRGILYPALKQRGYPQLALWGTALFFALMHANMTTFIPLAFLALFLTFLYERSGNLLAPILTHSLFNAANFIMLLYRSELERFLKDWS
ncbi:MAG: CPBP family intramembrane metalloprotease [Proteobacteria bacterium]|nr:CPBP family intramembrane metalloprotease [Pseudomonadota bacterium]